MFLPMWIRLIAVGLFIWVLEYLEGAVLLLPLLSSALFIACGVICGIGQYREKRTGEHKGPNGRIPAVLFAAGLLLAADYGLFQNDIVFLLFGILVMIFFAKKMIVQRILKDETQKK